MGQGPLVVQLGESGFGPMAVGGKAANLGELIRAGFDVPPGFVVVAAAFERFGGGVALPADVEHEIVAAYQRLGSRDGPEPPVAVRSSAIGEDCVGTSFAGLHDTFLWQRGRAQVIDRVRQCWASLYSHEALEYRSALCLDGRAAGMGVIVQRMVEADISGVAFTVSPASGDPSVIAVEAGWGLGTSVVGGEVTPDSFRISKVTGEVIERAIGSKHFRYIPNRGSDGVTAEPVPEVLRAAACLDDDQLLRVVRLAAAVERHYGRPQDIEWALELNASASSAGRLSLLQSRPETVWSQREGGLASPRADPVDYVVASLLGDTGAAGPSRWSPS